MIITIDGPAASGKSTVARLLAEKLGAGFLDTGAMYRAVTLAATQAGVDMSDEEKLLEVLDNKEFQFTIEKSKIAVFIDGVDVTEQIRGPEVTANARYIASSAKVREKLVQMQRQIVSGVDKIVTEGRDQGTVAFPNADIKFFLTAETIERARRRRAELSDKGEGESLERIQRAIEERDKSDENRTVGPLRPASDAIVVDTTNLSIEEVVEKVLSYVEGPRSPEKKPNLVRDPCPIRNSTKGACTPKMKISNRAKEKVSNGAKMRWFRFARWICKVFCRLFFEIHVYGKENVPEEGAFVLVSNHQSYLDPVFCGIPLKRHLYFLARDTLFTNWFFGWLISSVNTIPVRRGEADLSAVKKVIGKLKEGGGVCLFPEATRTRDGKIATFKPGFGLICRRGEAAVVPVVIDGAFECWPRHKKIFSPGTEIAICYGKCITAGEVANMDDRELAETLTDTLRRMQNDCRVKQGKEPYNY